jgi:hypothetical protein
MKKYIDKFIFVDEILFNTNYCDTVTDSVKIYGNNDDNIFMSLLNGDKADNSDFPFVLVKHNAYPADASIDIIYDPIICLAGIGNDDWIKYNDTLSISSDIIKQCQKFQDDSMVGYQINSKSLSDLTKRYLDDITNCDLNKYNFGKKYGSKMFLRKYYDFFATEIWEKLKEYDDDIEY